MARLFALQSAEFAHVVPFVCVQRHVTLQISVQREFSAADIAGETAVLEMTYRFMDAQILPGRDHFSTNVTLYGLLLFRFLLGCSLAEWFFLQHSLKLDNVSTFFTTYTSNYFKGDILML